MRWPSSSASRRADHGRPVPSAATDRIAIIGCGGSGKTTIGRQLGEFLGVQVTHLDVVFYDDDWNTLPKEKFTAIQEDLVAGPQWVIDGNFASTLPIRLRRADTAVFLDLPAITCLWGIAQRRIRHGGGQNDATGVYDRIHWGFIKYVWKYRTTMSPRVRALIDEHAGHADVYILRSRHAANRFLAQATARQ